MRKFILCFFILQFYCLVIFAQSFYVSTYVNDDIGIPTGYIQKITITPTGVTYQPVATCPNTFFFSIAMKGNNFYWLDNNQFYKADFNGNTLSNCIKLADFPATSNSLTVGPDGNAYYIDYTLKSFNPSTLEVKDYGQLNYSPSGDITFFNGDLYMASGDGIVKIDKNSPANSTVIIPTTGPIFGLVSVATSIRDNTVYALMYISESQTDIYELDIDSKKVVGKVGSLPFAVLDAASMVEDGSIQGVKINKINIHQDCDAPTKGIIEVITLPHTDIFTYTLSNGLINNTGVFTGVASGTYQLTVSSILDNQTRSIVIPAYSLTKPQYTVGITNLNCNNPGQIAFVADINSTYTIKYKTNSFPLNHVFSDLSAGSYHFEIYNESGCKTDEKYVNVEKYKCFIQIT